MVAYTVETRLLPQQVEWDRLITAACAAARVDTDSAITAVSLTHSIADLSDGEVETIISLAGRRASEAGLSLETDASTRHLTLRFRRPGKAVEEAKSVSFGTLLGGIWSRRSRSRGRHS
jgi:hypothetical protein